MAIPLMLAALAGRLLVGLLGPSAVEWDPYHTHVTVGGTPRQQAAALARHRHESTRSTATCHDHDGHGVRVVSLTAGVVGVSVASLAAGASATAADTEVPRPGRSDRISSSPIPCPELVPRPVLEPPPEIA